MVEKHYVNSYCSEYIECGIKKCKNVARQKLQFIGHIFYGVFLNVKESLTTFATLMQTEIVK